MWARKSSLIAGLAASLAVVSLTGFAGVVWQWRRAEAQQAQAEHNFREARRLVDAFYTRVFTEGMFFRPGLESVRREMFRDLLGYYRDFLRQRRDDPTLQADLAETCFRVGCLTTEEGDKADAISEEGTSLNSASLAPKPVASSASVRVPEAPCPHKRSILVTSLLPSRSVSGMSSLCQMARSGKSPCERGP